MKLLLSVLLFVVVLGASARMHTRWHELEPRGYGFEDYVQEYHKSYADSAEKEFRRQVFDANLKQVMEHNRKGLSWKLGVNHLSDRTAEEIAKLRGYKKHMANSAHVASRRAAMATEFRAPTIDLPASVDWRLKGVITPVKDQGQCGSCWTFASTETIESFWFLRTGQLFELSEQQIASCTPNPQQCGGTGGCEGGTAEVAFQGVITNGGLASEWTYPYASWNGTDYACRLGTTGFNFQPFANLSSYVKLPVNDQNALMTAVASLGPISISVDASAWSFYESGVFNGCNNTAPTIDHAVQLVGYGTDDGQDYWVVRNSWTPTWGEGGYIRVARPATAPCGNDPNPGDGTACQPYPATQYVCGVCGILSDSAYPIVGV